MIESKATQIMKTRPFSIKSFCRYAFFFSVAVIVLIVQVVLLYQQPIPALKMKPRFERAVQDLRNLQQIARDHGESRSVVKGHLASVKYVQDELAQYNETWVVSTQNVPVTAQVDEEDPVFDVWYGQHQQNRSFLPRLEVATARGSGSARLVQSRALFIDSCSVSVDEEDWIAVLDYSSPSQSPNDCNVCDRMVDAIRSGAKGVVFLTKPGTLEGYPHGLPPGRGPCGRIPRYQLYMKTIGALTLGDHAAFEFLSMMASRPKSLIDLKVVSAFREFQTLNVLADSVEGDAENVVLFGSHLDGVPQGPGINDDGTGAMATLELARSFAESGIKPKQKLRLAFWAAEEIGLVGSRYYVDQLALNDPDELKRIKLSMDNDMLGELFWIWFCSPLSL